MKNTRKILASILGITLMLTMSIPLSANAESVSELDIIPDAHVHNFTIQKSSKVVGNDFLTQNTEIGICDCGLQYEIWIDALCYDSANNEYSPEVYVVMKQLHDSDLAKSEGEDLSTDSLNNSGVRDYYSSYPDACMEDEFRVEVSELTNDGIGTHQGTITLLDDDVAEMYGGAVHDFQYEVRNILEVSDVKMKYVYTGKTIKPLISVVPNTNGKVETTVEPVSEKCYSIAIYDFSDGTRGKSVKMLNVGTYCFEVTPAEGYSIIKSDDTIPLKVVPKKASIGITTGKGKVTVKFSTPVSSTGGDKYQIRYRKVGTETWKTLKTERQTKAVRNLTKGKRYEIQARATKTIDGMTYYGSWSTVKTSTKVK